MKKMTERSAKWMETVVANCQKNTGRSLAQWTQLARKAKVADFKAAHAWGRKQALSTVYATAVAETLFPTDEAGEEALVDAQYSGPKAALRAIYDSLVKAARGLGDDVEIMPRKSQVTFSRQKSFAVVRAATKDRVEIGFKLHGTPATKRLVANAKATASDPSHTVGLGATSEVNRELVGWLGAAYDRAGPRK